MARPTKDGLDYFPHDVDAVNDEKIESLMFLHGAKGYAFYFIHLERIYRTSMLELDISDAETRQILAKKCGINIEEYESILSTCLKRKCFNVDEYQTRGVLTSNGVKKRAAIVLSKREKMRQKYHSELKTISDAEIREETPQSKEKKSKEKKSIANNISSLTQTVNTQFEIGTDICPTAEISIFSNDKKSIQVNKHKALQEIVDLFNSVCISLPKVQRLTETRKNKLLLRWKEIPDLEQWKNLFLQIEDTPFLKGVNAQNWSASFDWLISNDCNITKVLEGQYRDKKIQGPSQYKKDNPTKTNELMNSPVYKRSLQIMQSGKD